MKGKRKKYQKKLPHEVSKALGFPHMGLQLTEEEIRDAMAHSDSNVSAARYMGITKITYKKYAERYVDIETGKTLYEIHKNKGGRYKKKTPKGPKLYKKQMDNLLVKQKWTNPRRVALLRNMMQLHGLQKDSCEACGYDKRRIKDDKLPLMIHFVNGDRKDWSIENIKWLCYNCYFENVGDPFAGRVLRNMESSQVVGEETSEESNLLFYNLDEFYLQEIEKLGKFVEEGRYTEEEDLIDFKKDEDEDLKKFVEEFKYAKTEFTDENDFIDRRI
jgi:hypothetical protein